MTIEWTGCDLSRKEFWEREELVPRVTGHPLRVWHVLLVSAGVWAVVVWIGVTLWKW